VFFVENAMPELTLCNAAGRDAQVAAESVKIPVRIRRLDRDGRQCSPARILKGTLATRLLAIGDWGSAKTREPLADLLIQGDPEIDLEAVGGFLRDTKCVYVDPAGKVVHAVTHQEIVKNPDGSEKLRRPHAVLSANLALPLRWSGKLIPRAEAARKFVFASKRQIRHVNGLTYDFLFAIARELERNDALLLVGAGPKGNQPLVLRRGAMPYRGFLEGRTRADEYLLLLHLSNLELKTPETTKDSMQRDQAAA
jgi:hypothetical protein